MDAKRIESLKADRAAAERAIERHSKAANDHPEDAARFLSSVELARKDIERIDAQLTAAAK